MDKRYNDLIIHPVAIKYINYNMPRKISDLTYNFDYDCRYSYSNASITFVNLLLYLANKNQILYESHYNKYYITPYSTTRLNYDYIFEYIAKNFENDNELDLLSLINFKTFSIDLLSLIFSNKNFKITERIFYNLYNLKKYKIDQKYIPIFEIYLNNEKSEFDILKFIPSNITDYETLLELIIFYNEKDIFDVIKINFLKLNLDITLNIIYKIINSKYLCYDIAVLIIKYTLTCLKLQLDANKIKFMNEETLIKNINYTMIYTNNSLPNYVCNFNSLISFISNIDKNHIIQAYHNCIFINFTNICAQDDIFNIYFNNLIYFKLPKINWNISEAKTHDINVISVTKIFAEKMNNYFTEIYQLRNSFIFINTKKFLENQNKNIDYYCIILANIFNINLLKNLSKINSNIGAHIIIKRKDYEIIYKYIINSNIVNLSNILFTI